MTIFALAAVAIHVIVAGEPKISKGEKMELMFTVNYIIQIIIILVVVRQMELSMERRHENHERLLRKIDDLISKQRGRL